MSYSPQVNDYVTWNTAGDYGVVKSVDPDASTAVVVDKDGTDQSDIAYADMKPSAMARMTLKAGPNVIELLENIAPQKDENILYFTEEAIRRTHITVPQQSPSPG